jgi:hypothetical protein
VLRQAADAEDMTVSAFILSTVVPRAREPLTAEHDLSSFNCGKLELNKWLGDYALASQKADLARTWILIEDNRVIGYFSLMKGHVSPKTPTRSQ